MNIYQELRDDLGILPPSHGCLVDWAEQGVLLLNTVLTVRARHAQFPQGERLGTVHRTQVIRLLTQRQEPMVFLLWGANAKSKRSLITNPSHLILTAAHPSPYRPTTAFLAAAISPSAMPFCSSTAAPSIGRSKNDSTGPGIRLSPWQTSRADSTLPCSIKPWPKKSRQLCEKEDGSCRTNRDSSLTKRREKQ